MTLLGTAVVGLVTIALTAAVNIKIKFAPDAATARRDLATLALKLASWAANALNAFNLYSYVTSTEPITRFTVLAIAVCVAALYFSLQSFLLNTHVRMLTARMDKHLDVMEGHLGITKDLEARTSEAIKDLAARQVQLGSGFIELIKKTGDRQEEIMREFASDHTKIIKDLASELRRRLGGSSEKGE